MSAKGVGPSIGREALPEFQEALAEFEAGRAERVAVAGAKRPSDSECMNGRGERLIGGERGKRGSAYGPISPAAKNLSDYQLPNAGAGRKAGK